MRRVARAVIALGTRYPSVSSPRTPL
jgi:hypothetical protein